MIDIDALKRDKRPQSSTLVHALIDRLEAAEKELAELRSSMKFRTSLIGRTEAERDDAKAAAENIALKLDYLRSKLETAKSAQNDWLRANAPGGWIDNLRIENEALRAKVEQMEKQEPVGKIVAFGESLHEPSWRAGRLPPLMTELYALPGAKGE